MTKKPSGCLIGIAAVLLLACCGNCINCLNPNYAKEQAAREQAFAAEQKAQDAKDAKEEAQRKADEAKAKVLADKQAAAEKVQAEKEERAAEAAEKAERDKAPDGATAQCEDGTYSFSENHRGTCSHHGGVARWLD